MKKSELKRRISILEEIKGTTYNKNLKNEALNLSNDIGACVKILSKYGYVDVESEITMNSGRSMDSYPSSTFTITLKK